MAIETRAITLIRTKMQRPRLPDDLIPRRRLLDRMRAGSVHKLTLISAMAGTGKTTLLAQWLADADCPQPSAWLSLDEHDNDPVVFLHYLIAAVRTTFPHSCEKAFGLLSAPKLPPVRAITAALVNELDDLDVAPSEGGARSASGLVLALDDYHYITEPKIHEILSSLVELLPQGVHLTIATRTDPPLPLACWYARLGEAYLIAGRRQEGLEALEESFRYEHEVWWLPEQHRVRAQLLLLAPGNEVEAEAGFRKALEVARSQKSKSLELRAAVSLARLLRQQGRVAEGRNLLAECYFWFTEGVDTADLQEARGLLETLEKEAERESATGDDQKAEGFEDLAVGAAPASSAPTSMLSGAEQMGSGSWAQPEKRMSTGGS